MKALLHLFIIVALAANSAPAQLPKEKLPRLKVSDNGRFLVTEAGKPFFWLGDTAWSLFQRLNREEADRYLKDRASKGFNVIQAVALWRFTEGSAYGHLPFVDEDPARPAVQDGPANDYWDHVDYIVDRANSLGLYVGFLPTWGSFWHNPIRDGKPLFNPQNAEAYGLWLGRRYKDRGIIWILGGDNLVENDTHKAIMGAMARGLRQGDSGAHLITFHPRGGRGSAEVFHNEPWLDFNMRQNGHVAEFTGRFEKTREDYDRRPAKPVLDGEPLYEDHPVSFNHKQLGHSIAADVRRALYWNLFSGACGHTYGHHSVWSMHVPGDGRNNIMLMPWHEALEKPGARQMQYGRRLMESRPFLSRVPDDSVIVPSGVPTSVPGAGTRRFVATRDANGSYAMVYAPVGRAFSVRMNKVTGPRVKAWWFNPRNGQAQLIGELPNTGTRQFLSSDPGELMDWVLVLDDASKNYPPPGQAETDDAGGSVSSTGPVARPEFIGRGAYPDIAADTRGGLHVVFVREGTLRYLHRPPGESLRTAGAGPWSAEEDTGLPQGMAHRSDPEIALDPKGRLYALVGSTVARREGGEWHLLKAAFERDTDLALNSLGDAFIVRRGGHNGGFLGFLKCPPDSDTFRPGPDPDVAAGFGPGRNDHVYGSIAVSPLDDSLHIVYRHGTPKKIAYRVSTDGGKTWHGGGIAGVEPEAPAITVGHDGRVFVANADGHVFVRGGSPDQWTDLGQAVSRPSWPRRAEGILPSDRGRDARDTGRRDLPEVAVDRAGAVHVVAFGGQYNRFANGKWDGARTLPSRKNPARGDGLGYADLALTPDRTVWIAYEEGPAVHTEEPSGESDILLLRIPPAT